MTHITPHITDQYPPTHANTGAPPHQPGVAHPQALHAHPVYSSGYYYEPGARSGWQDWEFKVLQAPNGEFSQDGHVQRALSQEAQAGWQGLEKLNAYQLRLARPRAASAYDHQLPPHVDPYRTVYTLSYETQFLRLVFYGGCVVLVLLAMSLAVILATLPLH